MNTFGRIFRVSIFGESHGETTGVIIDGCPAGVGLTASDLTGDLSRRRPGAKGTTGRLEKDIPEIRSGLFKGFTTGSPILIEFTNENTDSGHYEKYKTVPRPGHADFAARVKYGGFNDNRGGGQFSGRLTVGLVAAGVIAKKILAGIEFRTVLLEAGGSGNYQSLIESASAEGDTLGGVIECSVSGLPVGTGEPFFDSVESVISHIVFSVPSVKGIEFGEGFRSAQMKGSLYNDSLTDTSGKTATNNCGGITGGLSNGNEIIFRAALRPPSSVLKVQKSLNLNTGKIEELTVTGRHDVCPALRSCVIIESAAAVGICDLFMTAKALKHK